MKYFTRGGLGTVIACLMLLAVAIIPVGQAKADIVPGDGLPGIGNIAIPPIPGILTINVVVVGPNAPTDFPVFIDGNAATIGPNFVQDGVHTVSETVMNGYTATFSDACNTFGQLNVGSGEPKLCTITNTFTGSISDVTGSIKITKNVVGSDGETDVTDATEFTVHLDDTHSGTVSEGNDLVFSDLMPGVYTVTEDATDGYKLLSAAPSAQVTVTAGQTATVSLTNEQMGGDGCDGNCCDGNCCDGNCCGDTNCCEGDCNGTTTPETGTITIHKNVINFDGTDIKDNTAFTVNLVDENSEREFSTSSTVSEDNVLTFTDLAPGTYDVTENDASGYSLATITPAVVTVTAGSNTDVTITNEKAKDNGSSGTGDNPATTTERSAGHGGGFVGRPGGQVLGASIGTSNTGNGTGTSTACVADYLSDYVIPSKHWNLVDVVRLQLFLNDQLGLHNPVTGNLGPATIAAVEQYQLAHAHDILDPWMPFGLAKNTPTGLVYKTTKWFINNTMCPNTNLPFPKLP